MEINTSGFIEFPTLPNIRLHACFHTTKSIIYVVINKTIYEVNAITKQIFATYDMQPLKEKSVLSIKHIPNTDKILLSSQGGKFIVLILKKKVSMLVETKKGGKLSTLAVASDSFFFSLVGSDVVYVNNVRTNSSSTIILSHFFRTIVTIIPTISNGSQIVTIDSDGNMNICDVFSLSSKSSLQINKSPNFLHVFVESEDTLAIFTQTQLHIFKMLNDTLNFISTTPLHFHSRLIQVKAHPLFPLQYLTLFSSGIFSSYVYLGNSFVQTGQLTPFSINLTEPNLRDTSDIGDPINFHLSSMGQLFFAFNDTPKTKTRRIGLYTVRRPPVIFSRHHPIQPSHYLSCEPHSYSYPPYFFISRGKLYHHRRILSEATFVNSKQTKTGSFRRYTISSQKKETPVPLYYMPWKIIEDYRNGSLAIIHRRVVGVEVHDYTCIRTLLGKATNIPSKVSESLKDCCLHNGFFYSLSPSGNCLRCYEKNNQQPEWTEHLQKKYEKIYPAGKYLVLYHNKPLPTIGSNELVTDKERIGNKTIFNQVNIVNYKAVLEMVTVKPFHVIQSFQLNENEQLIDMQIQMDPPHTNRIYYAVLTTQRIIILDSSFKTVQTINEQHLSIFWVGWAFIATGNGYLTIYSLNGESYQYTSIPISSYIIGTLPNAVVLIVGDGFNSSLQTIEVSTFEIYLFGEIALNNISKDFVRLMFRRFGCPIKPNKLCQLLRDCGDDLLADFIQLPNTRSEDPLIQCLISSIPMIGLNTFYAKYYVICQMMKEKKRILYLLVAVLLLGKSISLIQKINDQNDHPSVHVVVELLTTNQDNGNTIKEDSISGEEGLLRYLEIVPPTYESMLSLQVGANIFNNGFDAKNPEYSVYSFTDTKQNNSKQTTQITLPTIIDFVQHLSCNINFPIDRTNDNTLLPLDEDNIGKNADVTNSMIEALFVPSTQEVPTLENKYPAVYEDYLLQDYLRNCAQNEHEEDFTE
ncbi:hypothetical protein QTN25_008900 [Entamoeba marina]